jgi:hypothetical protein
MKKAVFWDITPRGSCKTTVLTRATRRPIPEDVILQRVISYDFCQCQFVIYKVDMRINRHCRNDRSEAAEGFPPFLPRKGACCNAVCLTGACAGAVGSGATLQAGKSLMCNISGKCIYQRLPSDAANPTARASQTDGGDDHFNPRLLTFYWNGSRRLLWTP